MSWEPLDRSKEYFAARNETDLNKWEFTGRRMTPEVWRREARAKEKAAQPSPRGEASRRDVLLLCAQDPQTQHQARA